MVWAIEIIIFFFLIFWKVGNIVGILIYVIFLIVQVRENQMLLEVLEVEVREELF